MIASASIRIRFFPQKQLTALIEALTPEVHKQIGKRSKINITQDGQDLVLIIEANDTVALRAALNAYLRWINSTVNVLETIEKVT